MCVVSMVIDHYREKWAPYSPISPLPNSIPPFQLPTPPFQLPTLYPQVPSPAEIEEFRKLLEKARQYDKKHNHPDCGLEEKKELLRKLAQQLGVEIGEL